MTMMPKQNLSMEAIMSKIGRVNLELQEQVNEWGYDTVEEAIADGWDANEAMATLVGRVDEDEELENAHKAWLKEKEEVIKGLQYVATQTTGAKEEYVRKAIDFIEKGEV